MRWFWSSCLIWDQRRIESTDNCYYSRLNVWGSSAASPQEPLPLPKTMLARKVLTLILQLSALEIQYRSIQIPLRFTDYQTQTDGLSSSRKVLMVGIEYFFSTLYSYSLYKLLEIKYKQFVKKLYCLHYQSNFLIFVLWIDSCLAQRWIWLELSKCENKLQ